MKRTPLSRKTALRQHSPLKRNGELKRTRTPLKRLRTLMKGVEQRWSTLPRVNEARAAKRRLRDFGGPYGDVLIPRLPCCVCFPWWYLKTDEELKEAFADVLFDPERFAVVSEPAHVTHSRGAGGDASALVPLDSACHFMQHAIGVKSFADAYQEIPFDALAARLWRIWLTFNMSEDG